MVLGDGIYSTGEIHHGITEQALIIRMQDGLVVVTGCAHPGVEQMVGRAVDLSRQPVILVIGGFHLGDASSQKVERVITRLKELDVQQVAPCHCTGDQAISAFKDSFGEGFIQVGVGKVITIPMDGAEVH
jgi:7,8-dihydropterin-6-yl-methyl-4-(beta-D-ribofuranosyl)aminobenzene 5'-phosphate synthase